MKTNYTIYGIYDSTLEAYLPDSIGVFLTDKQASVAFAQGLLGCPVEKLDEAFHRYRFYEIGCFDVAKLSPIFGHDEPTEITDLVHNTYDVLKSQKEGKKDE